MNDVNVTDSLALHRALLTLDTHIDIPWPTGPDPFQDGTRRVDLPKMQRGGLAAGCFVAYVPQSARTPDSERAAFERAMAKPPTRPLITGGLAPPRPEKRGFSGSPPLRGSLTLDLEVSKKSFSTPCWYLAQ